MMDETTTKAAQHLVFWPSPQDYDEAVQNPSVCLQDDSLKQGVVETNAIGLPRVVTGMFASVYKLSCVERDYAVRCFLRHYVDIEVRYSLIEDALVEQKLPFMLFFDFQEEGIRVQGKWFPILKMEWCEGLPLNEWITKNLRNSQAIRSLADSWRKLVIELRSTGLAHGDLQHGNVLIEKNGEIKLVDYDGMFAPILKRLGTHEIGHRNYQHPERNESHYGPELDHFSARLIYNSLLIISADSSIWKTVNGGDECLLLRQSDFVDPEASSSFHLLEHHADQTIVSLAREIRYLLSISLEHVPDLEVSIKIPADFPQLPSKPVIRSKTNTVDQEEHVDTANADNQPWYAASGQASKSGGAHHAHLSAANAKKARNYNSAKPTASSKASNPQIGNAIALSFVVFAVVISTAIFSYSSVSDDISRAAAGDVKKQVHLAMMYEDGDGVSQDERKAFYWFKKAAEQGDSLAQYEVGWHYAHGEGVEKNSQEAFRWYQKSADQLNAKGQFEVGYSYATGAGVIKNDEQAAKYYQLSANQGNTDAIRNLALLYVYGEGVPKDAAKGVDMLKSIIKSSPSACYFLGYIYENGQAGPVDYAAAARYYNFAANGDDNEGSTSLALLYEKGKGVAKQDFSAAVGLLTAAANRGYAPAQTELGNLYAAGTGVNKDEATAMLWWGKALAQGNAGALEAISGFYQKQRQSSKVIMALLDAASKGNAQVELDLAKAYDFGLYNVPKNPQEAVKWYSKSAAQGNAEAQFSMGYAYELGQGVPKTDFTLASKYYQSASDRGNARASFNLARLYLSEKGVKKDSPKAFSLFQKAVDQSDRSTDELTAVIGPAMNEIGKFYETGEPPIKKDLSKALDYFRQSAEAGNAIGEYNYGRLLIDGKGNKSAAIQWLEKAATQGVPEAAFALAEVYEKGTGVQKDPKLAKQWTTRAKSLESKE